MANYEFREIRKEDIPKILKLFTECYPNQNKFSKEYLVWQYFENPNGEVIGFNAWHDNEIAAHYSVIPTVFEKEDIIYNACQSLNTATSPHHQFKGLFIKLANLTYDKATTKGYDFVYASANKNSIGGFLRKLDFELLGRIGILFGYFGNTLNYECLKQKYSNKAFKWKLVWIKIQNYNFDSEQDKKNLKSSPLLSLRPFFGNDAFIGIKVPEFIKPSPWYLIVKKLKKNIEINNLKIEGINMDTF